MKYNYGNTASFNLQLVESREGVLLALQGSDPQSSSIKKVISLSTVYT